MDPAFREYTKQVVNMFINNIFKKYSKNFMICNTEEF